MTTQVQPKDRTVAANGINIRYLDWGDPSSPKMVLLHGLRGHAHAWNDFSEPMSKDYNVLALDQRGRGGSDWAPDKDYTTDAYVADLAAFCEVLNLDSFVLVGHSMGGRNAAAFTTRYPERVNKLVMVDVGPVSDPRGANRIRDEVLAVADEFDSFEALYEYMSKENTYASERGAAQAFAIRQHGSAQRQDGLALRHQDHPREYASRRTSPGRPLVTGERHQVPHPYRARNGDRPSDA